MPAPLGITPSFGFGDRARPSTPGHIACSFRNAIRANFSPSNLFVKNAPAQVALLNRS